VALAEEICNGVTEAKDGQQTVDEILAEEEKEIGNGR